MIRVRYGRKGVWIYEGFVKTILAALAIGIAVINVVDSVQRYIEIREEKI